jgi:oxalate---CoA ligase
LTPQDCCLSVSPLFYSHGLKVTVFTPLLSGGTVAFPRDSSRFDYMEWFGRLKPTWYSAGPTLHRLVFDQIKSRSGVIADSSLRFVVSGGAPLPRDILDGLQRLLSVPVVEQYGTSEAAVVASNAPQPGRLKPGTCGVPWPDTVRIVSEDGRPVPSGETGEILLGGPSLISGYLDAPELNRASFVGGWFRTGDIGSVDGDGFLTLHGRKNDLINRGGEKISPVEIDEALLRHPAVAEAAAFPVPHPRLGEDIAAAAVLRAGMWASPVELRRFLHGQVTSFKVPRRIVIRDKLPKGATGKVLRRLLTESLKDEPAEFSSPVPPQKVDGKSVDLTIRVTSLWERLLKIAPLSLDDDFFEKGGDSLLAVNMLAELDEMMGEAIPASILLEAPTIRQLAYRLSERSKSGPENLVQINPNGRQQPLVLFHGDYIWGGGYLSLGLTRALGSEQPILVVAPHGGGEAFPRSIEAMAVERLPLILDAQPEGPYRLCGFCIGGMIAFEAARLLLAAGKEVDVVFMIDSPTINARKSVRLLLSLIKLARPLLGPAVDRAKGWAWHTSADLQRFWNVSRMRKWTTVKTRAAKITSLIKSKKVRATTNMPSGGFTKFSDARTARYSTMMSNYNPKPLDVRVIYFSVDFGPGKWGSVSRNLEVVKSPGTHLLLDIPHIAGVLSTHLYLGRLRRG